MEVVMIGKWATTAANQGIALAASLLMRSAIKPLLEVDERSLFAVGLSRADIVACLSTPFTTDPTEFLASRGKKLRSGRGLRCGPRAARGTGPDPKKLRAP
jgi:hypothetical protein